MPVGAYDKPSIPAMRSQKSYLTLWSQFIAVLQCGGAAMLMVESHNVNETYFKIMLYLKRTKRKPLVA
ncbi:MAG: hypothetical protein WD469_03565 [Paenibacillaceae bacterium]